MQRYVKYFVHGRAICTLAEEQFWPSLLTAANSVDALHTDIAAVPDCPPKFTLLIRLPNSPNWLHEQTLNVLQGLLNDEFCVRVVPGDATLHVSRMYGQCSPVLTIECYKAEVKSTACKCQVQRFNSCWLMQTKLQAVVSVLLQVLLFLLQLQ